MRINKYLSDMGFCSRRQADRLIAEGKVLVDGKPVDMGTRLNANQVVEVNKKVVGTINDIKVVERVLLAVNKPVGVVCTTSENDRAKNIVEMVNYDQRIYPIGRLDKDSRGLILMTNKGSLVNDIMRAANFHEKEYIVTIDRGVNEDFLNMLARGVMLKDLGVKTRRCKTWKISDTQFGIILTQGLNRQIRRMCEAFDRKVMDLKRVRIMNIELGDLKEGEYREITPSEYNALISKLR